MSFMHRSPHRRLSCSWVFYIASILLLHALSTPGSAQVSTVIKKADGSPTRVITPKHGSTTYKIKGGKVSGNNLLHSFQRFDVGTHTTAEFKDVPPEVTNILSRVTGTHKSIIDGQIKSASPGVHIFLLNPQGVVFKDNATLNVQGSFYVSTANVLQFADGTSFYADPSRDAASNSILQVASPRAFGFLDKAMTFRFTHHSPADITVNGSVLQVLPGNTLAVVGGNIQIVGGCPGTGCLVAPSGQLHIASVAARGEVRLDTSAPSPNLQLHAPGGSITLAEAARLDVSSNESSNKGSGRVVIRGGRLFVDNATIAALTNAEGAAIGTDIDVTEAVFTGSSRIITNTQGQGDAGGIQIHARQVTIEAGTGIVSNTTSGGSGGTVEVTATDRITIAGILSSSTVTSGEAGTVRITAPIIRIEAGGVLQATSAGPAPGGRIIVSAGDGEVTLTGTGLITSTTTAPGGSGGNIKLMARVVMLNDGAKISAISAGGGEAGTIRLQAEKIVLSGLNTAVTTATVGSDSGKGGTIALKSSMIQLREGAKISAESGGTGEAGTIRLTASDTLLLENSSITTQAKTAAGGAIQVTEHNLLHLRHSMITTEVESGAGGAGDITIDPEFTILENSQIITRAQNGEGGDITIAGKFLRDPASELDTRSLTNNAGEINIQNQINNLSEVAVPLRQDFASSTALLNDQCAARLREGTVSSLVHRGRDGIPASPEGLLPGRFSTADTASPTPTPAPQTLSQIPSGQASALHVDSARAVQVKNWRPAPASRHTLPVQCPPR